MNCSGLLPLGKAELERAFLAQVLGERVLAELRRLGADRPRRGDVRERGLMLGVEVVDADRLGGAWAAAERTAA